jgi:hypothetical protein
MRFHAAIVTFAFVALTASGANAQTWIVGEMEREASAERKARGGD